MKAKVDTELCAGTGVCEETCPAVFKVTDEGHASVIVEEVPADAEKACRKAMDSCPTGAISIEE